MVNTMALGDRAERQQSVDAAISSPRAAMLTNAQYLEVMRLRKLHEQSLEENDTDEADRLAALILSIIREGPPSFG